MSQKNTCLCGAETTTFYALPLSNPQPNATIEEKFKGFGLCMNCRGLLAQQINLNSKKLALSKIGVMTPTNELVGYAAEITKAGETGGEGETGLVTSITLSKGEKFATVVTLTGVFEKKLENVKKIYGAAPVA